MAYIPTGGVVAFACLLGAHQLLQQGVSICDMTACRLTAACASPKPHRSRSGHAQEESVLTGMHRLLRRAKPCAGLVKSRPLDRWRETLALLSAYSDTGEFCALADMLAKRLAGAGLPQVRRPPPNPSSAGAQGSCMPWGLSITLAQAMPLACPKGFPHANLCTLHLCHLSSAGATVYCTRAPSSAHARDGFVVHPLLLQGWCPERGMCREEWPHFKRVLPVQAATLAWICAANVDRAVKQWAAELRRPGVKEPPSTEALQVR